MTTYLTYTAVAFVVTASGLSLLVVNALSKQIPRITKQDIAGFFLVFLGTSLRPESGFATFVLFVPFILWVLIHERHLPSILRGIAAGIAAILAYAIGMAAYLLTPGWQQLPHALKIGRAITDTQSVDADTIQAVAPNLSNNDVDMLYAWWFGDKSVFSLDTFQKISAFVQEYSLSNILLIGKRNLLLTVMAIISLSLLAAFISLNMTRFVRKHHPLRHSHSSCSCAAQSYVRSGHFLTRYHRSVRPSHCLIQLCRQTDSGNDTSTAEHHIIETVAVIFYRSAQRHLHRLSLCISRQPR